MMRLHFWRARDRIVLLGDVVCRCDDDSSPDRNSADPKAGAGAKHLVRSKEEHPDFPRKRPAFWLTNPVHVAVSNRDMTIFRNR